MIKRLKEEILKEDKYDDDFNAGYKAAIEAIKKLKEKEEQSNTNGSDWNDLDSIEDSSFGDAEDIEREIRAAKEQIDDIEKEQGKSEEGEKSSDEDELDDALNKQEQETLNKIKNGETPTEEEIDGLKKKLDKIKKSLGRAQKKVKDEETHKEIEDVKIRAKKIDDFFSDPENFKNIEKENAIKKYQEADKKRADLEKSYYKKYAGQLFLNSLDKLIRSQIARIRERTWRRPDKNVVVGSDVLRKGRASVQSRNIPLISIYYDRSGSWNDPEKTAVGDQAIAMLRTRYERKGLIKLELRYFADEVGSNPDNIGGGTTATQKILDDIVERKSTNVIIMTDSDMETAGNFTKAVEVPGGVYFLFKGGRCERIMKYLRGKMLTEAYDL